MPSHRAASAAQVIRTVVGTIAREIPPDIAQIVSITDVEVSPDLAYATVYVSAFTKPKEAITYLKKNLKRELTRAIAAALNIYTVPVLRFVLDERGNRAERLEHLLSE